MGDLLRGHINDGNRPADFGTDPEPGTVMGEFAVARALAHKRIGKQLLGGGVDPMHHIGGL